LAKSKDELRLYQAEWARNDRKKNPEKYANRRKVAYPKNRDKILKQVKKYQENNSSKIKENKAIRYASQNYETRRDKTLMSLYGITLADYNSLYTNQHGRCKICEKHFDLLFVDHCHTTNIVRGLLCGKCNSGIGMLEENIDNLLRAIAYLTREKIA